jgi:DNA replication factor GINS
VYTELYGAWLREIDDPTLGVLQPDFYRKIGEYLKRIRQEDLVQDKKSVKTNLLTHESLNVERMLSELLEVRYRKIIKVVTKTQKLPVELLTFEEAKMCESFADFSRAYRKFADGLMQGQVVSEPIKVTIKVEATNPPEAPRTHRSTVRFIKSIPAIMGADMKSYGPFVAEDVASLPPQNAQILVKQGLAVLVETA